MHPSPRSRLGSLLVVTAIVVTGCGSTVDPTGTRVARSAEAEEVGESGGKCPPPDAEGSSAIDWVPFVAVSGVHYQPLFPVVEVPESARGRVVATVGCTISGTVGNPDYRIRDGDAAYLPVGTQLREIAGYRTDFRLAAYEDDGWRVYEAYHRDGAATGAELLDIDGKVTAIHLVEGSTGTGILRSVDDPGVVTAIVTALLAAPVIPETRLSDDRFDEPPLFVRFDLRDGSSVQRVWAVEAGVVDNALAAPEALTAALGPHSR